MCAACDFEKSECGWKSTPGNFEWVREHPVGVFLSNGPANDTTLGTDAGEIGSIFTN